MVNVWLFEFFHALRDEAAAGDRERVQAHFRFYTDLWVAAEARGFDGIFFSEHHFGAGYSPSPNLLVSHVAARTETLRLGVLGTVTPYATPWRVAEEFAMLDHLSGGRFEPGVVSGIPPELITAGIAIPAAGARHASTAAILNDALAGRPVSLHDDEYGFDDLALLPPMYRRSTRVWTAARTTESALKAAERGWRLCAGFNSVESIASMFDAYRSAAGACGRDVTPGDLGLRRMVTFTEAPGHQREGIGTAKRSLLDLLNASAGPLPPFAAVLDRPDESSDMLSDDEFVSGTAEEVADELIRQTTAVGAGHLMVMFSAVDPATLSDWHRRFGDDVIPRIRKATS